MITSSLISILQVFSEGELFLKGMHIAEYWWGNLNNHDPLRERKMLLTKRELRKIERKIKESGLTIIVTKVFLNDRGLAKAEIAVSKGKKEYDKRQSIKKKDSERELDRLRKK
jgi:SsrA-binding protein